MNTLSRYYASFWITTDYVTHRVYFTEARMLKVCLETFQDLSFVCHLGG